MVRPSPGGLSNSIITTAQFGNAMRLPLDANYGGLVEVVADAGTWLAGVDTAVIGCRLGCCTIVLHVRDLDAGPTAPEAVGN
jgi:hypothetical protein